MNRILLFPGELGADHRMALQGRRALHIRRVLRAAVGDTLKIGELNGLRGQGRVEAVSEEAVSLTVTLDEVSPPPWIDLLLALPRPKVLKRLWAQLAALGVGRIILINAARVERCYFDTHWVEPEAFTPLLIEGLEQAGTTHLPEVWLRRGFKPFIEDELLPLYGRSLKLLAHPAPGAEAAPLRPLSLPASDARPLLAIGPEGGWIEYELKQFATHGFSPLSLGPRTLRTDTACIALLGRLMPT